MSKHSTGGTNRQFISRRLVGLALTIVLIGGVVAAWISLGDRIDESATTEAAACVEGPSTVTVVADPAIAPGLQKIAQNYNATSPIVRDHCITVKVQPADARATLEGLTAKTWDEQAFGPFPGAWVPESSVWAAPVEVAKPDLLQGRPESLVSSPVRLAMITDLAAAANGDISWSDLPSLTLANSLRAFGHAEWGSLRMAMPNGPQSDATALAAQGVAAAFARTSDPLTAAQAKVPAVTGAVRQLVSAPPKVGDGTTQAAVTAIAGVKGARDAEVRAVPVTEQRVYAATRDDKAPRFTLVAPTGGTPVADYPVVRLAGTLVPPHVSDTVSEFFTFARKPQQMAILTGMGFRGTGPLPTATPTVRFSAIESPLPAPDAAAAVAISRIVLPAAAP